MCFDVLVEHSSSTLSAALGARVNMVRIGDASPGFSCARMVVTGISGARPGLLVMACDAGLTGRVASRVLGRQPELCEESELTNLLIELCGTLAERVVTECVKAGEHMTLAPALAVEVPPGRVTPECDPRGEYLAIETDIGTLFFGIIWYKEVPTEDRLDTSPSYRPRTLVVTSTPLLGRRLARVAFCSDLDVVSILDGLSACGEMERIRPDVVLLDVRPGEPHGLTCLRMLKRVLPEARILLVSGNGACEGLEEYLAIGASGFVLRPFEGRGLEKRLRRIAATRAGRASTSASQD